MTETEKLIEIYNHLEDAGLMVIAGKKDSAELMISHDVVPVVRCKDCKNYDPGYIRQDHGWCKEWGTAVRAGGFCHHGERRTDGN